MSTTPGHHQTLSQVTSPVSRSGSVSLKLKERRKSLVDLFGSFKANGGSENRRDEVASPEIQIYREIKEE